jgi:hypothetical protein
MTFFVVPPHKVGVHVSDSSESEAFSDGAYERRHRSGKSAKPLYKVLYTSADGSFELAQHSLSNQLLFVFSGLPNLQLAGKLEAMGFDHTSDERIFTLDCTEADRARAVKLAHEFDNPDKGMRR